VVKKSQEKKQKLPIIKRSRGQLVIDTTDFLLRQYPVKWTAKEIAVQLRANMRTMGRVLKDMTEKGLIENKYHTYAIDIEIIKRFYDSKWYVQQETNKSIMLADKGVLNTGPEAGLVSIKNQKEKKNGEKKTDR